MRKKTKRHPNIKSPSPFEIKVPKGHLLSLVSIEQSTRCIDKDEALKILKNRPHVSRSGVELTYRGATSKYHVFSYPDPTSSV